MDPADIMPSEVLTAVGLSGKSEHSWPIHGTNSCRLEVMPLASQVLPAGMGGWKTCRNCPWPRAIAQVVYHLNTCDLFSCLCIDFSTEGRAAFVVLQIAANRVDCQKKLQTHAMQTHATQTLQAQQMQAVG